MNEFWNHSDCYRAFQSCLHTTDRRRREELIADTIIRHGKRRWETILDVGAGDGERILSFIRALCTFDQLQYCLDVFEPEPEVRNICKNIIPSISQGGALRSCYSNIQEVGNQKYDLITFNHSAYYVDEDVIKNLYVKNLNPNGGMMFLIASNYEELAKELFRTKLFNLLRSISKNNIFVYKFSSHFLIDGILKKNELSFFNLLKFFMKTQHILPKKELKDKELKSHIDKSLQDGVWTSENYLFYIKT